MATVNLTLPDPVKDWIDAQTTSGRFDNASDYVLDLIRRDQKRQHAVEEIQHLVTEGVQSGEPEAFDFEAFLQRKRAAHGRRSA